MTNISRWDGLSWTKMRFNMLFNSLPAYCSACSQCSINISERRKTRRQTGWERDRSFLFSEISVKWDSISIYDSIFKEMSIKCFKPLKEKPACLVRELEMIQARGTLTPIPGFLQTHAQVCKALQTPGSLGRGAPRSALPLHSTASWWCQFRNGGSGCCPSVRGQEWPQTEPLLER